MSRVSGASSPLVVLAVLAWGDARAATPGDELAQVMLDVQVAVTVPADMAREQRSLGGRAEMLTLADGGDAMTVVVYHASAVGSAPDVASALAIHAEEIARVLGKAERRTTVRRLLGRERPAIAFATTFGGVEREAWVVAATAKGRTVVVTALAVKGGPTAAAMLAIADGIRAP